MSRLGEVFEECRAQSRAALIGYLPAGFPTVEGSKDVLRTMVSSGCDVVEVGLPFSDPVMDGPTIQRAAETALRGGFRVRDLFGVVESVASAGGRAVVMTYWNPVLAYGVDRFARDLAAAGGLGVITPDLVPDEGAEWIAATEAHDLDRIFLVAPSSSAERIRMAARSSRGFLYATSVMGVTGARDVVSSAAPALVKRVREHTDMPVGVGLGVRNGAQAAELAAVADGVIVGSAFVSAVEDDGVAALTEELARGVRQVAAPA
ncbi:tryptophan synthase subunit alpha [Saccharothrix syringae]|uniref:Tryptophan synthase alpha chain n=1 Tax=Saccharothrix syringae TaxID=103733 RepID=A0A5Q0H9A2_SACSY|nr:tryptophan synthase subunit alpha [Saccharothrix syringae]QFZ22524.1 tryptophan synthase subunit alpha [Saccharothrix syringae]